MKGWTEHALQQLEDAGYRKGGARRAVVDHLGSQSCAVSAFEVEAALRESGRAVGRASVYRVLEQLATLRLVSRLSVGDGTTRYEVSHPSGEHHHHLVCRSCGTAVEVSGADVERWAEATAGKYGFVDVTHTVEIFGTCHDCAAKPAQDPPAPATAARPAT